MDRIGTSASEAISGASSVDDALADLQKWAEDRMTKAGSPSRQRVSGNSSRQKRDAPSPWWEELFSWRACEPRERGEGVAPRRKHVEFVSAYFGGGDPLHPVS